MPSGKLWYLAEDAQQVEGWRDQLRWPVTPTFLRELGERVCEASIAGLAAEQDPDRRQILAVGLPSLINSFMVLVELAYVAVDAQASKAEVISPPPEFEAFRTGARPTDVAEDTYRNKGVHAVAPADKPLLRSIARTHSWSGTAGLLPAMMGRDGWVLSHNGLLIGYLREKRIRACFHNVANIIAATRTLKGEALVSPSALMDLVDRAVAGLTALCDGLSEAVLAQLHHAIAARLVPIFEQVAKDVSSLRLVKGLPNTVWTGTNGSYATRLLVSEIRRRGGQVNVFDHGGVTGISQLPGLTAEVEGIFATRFHVGTPKWRDLVIAAKIPQRIAAINDLEIKACSGEPVFQKSCIDDTAARKRRQAIYVSHPYYGQRQFAISGMRDPIYMDFQIDLIERLKQFDLDLLIKPHPEGHFGDDTYPLQTMAPTSFQRFENHLRDADVFIFDAPTSTTFCEALCTRRPVILLERTQYPVNPALRAELEARCIIVPTRYDERNRLRVDAEALGAAMAALPDAADPSYFRSLLVGDAG